MPAASQKTRKGRGPCTVEAFARRVGVDQNAIRRAMTNGRITRWRLRKGRHEIIDPAGAEREWRAYRDGLAQNDTGADRNGGDYPAPGPVLAARLRAIEAKSRLHELEYQRRRGELVPKAEVELAWTGLVVAARTKLLGLAARIKQRIPEPPVSAVGVIDGLVREALEELGRGEERR